MARSALGRKAGSVTKILIVDDEPDVRHILRRIFEKAGYEITEAIHGAAALGELDGELPDLVVTDLMMPVMDGNELVKALRNDPRTAKIPIVSLTGNPASSVGADLVLKKIPKRDDLLAAVTSVLEGKTS